MCISDRSLLAQGEPLGDRTLQEALTTPGTFPEVGHPGRAGNKHGLWRGQNWEARAQARVHHVQWMVSDEP